MLRLIHHHTDSRLLYLHNNILLVSHHFGVGVKGTHNFGLERRNPPSHKVPCDSPDLFSAPRRRSFWRGQQLYNHYLCQTISCKCPQLGEQHFRNGPTYESFDALIGQRGAAMSNHLPAISFITQHSEFDGHVPGRAWVNLTVSNRSASQDNTAQGKELHCLLTVSDF